MLKAIALVLKLAAFAAIVLVVANMLKWDGKTVSDQVKSQIAHAERSEIADRVRELTGTAEDRAARELRERKAKLTESIRRLKGEDAREKDDSPRVKDAAARERSPAREHLEEIAAADAPQARGERIQSSERQKLKALMKELNSPKR
jgi:hypothetical protein